jgi:hypothetical protein
LILIIIGILGFVGWFVYHAQQNVNKTYSSSTNDGAQQISAVKTYAECQKAVGSKTLTTYPAQCMTKSGKTFTDTAAEPQGYLTVNEWAVKIVFADAGKVTYKFARDSSGVESVRLYLRPEVTSIVTCQDLGVSYTRDLPPNLLSKERQTVGSHQYELGGSPSACDEGNGQTDGTINQLRSKIVGDELRAAKLMQAN